MKKHIKEFMLRGLICAGFGPVVLAVVYFIISLFDSSIMFSGKEILLGVVSIYILAFVHAGASVFTTIEEWGLAKTIGVHFAVLYVAYSLCYLINSWIPFDFRVFLIFTAIFVAVYAVVWTIVYLCVRNLSRKLNATLQNYR